MHIYILSSRISDFWGNPVGATIYSWPKQPQFVAWKDKLFCFFLREIFHLQSKFDGCLKTHRCFMLFSSPFVSVFFGFIYGSNNDITTKL